VNTDVQPRLLVVETVPRGTKAFRHALSIAGYYVALAAGESGARRIVGTGSPDAIIVDLPPCEKTAAEVCKRLRAKEKDLPLLVLSPEASVLDSVTELDPGVDDYLVRPFALGEFLARVRALLRRSDTIDEPVSFSGLTLDPRTRAVERGAGRSISPRPSSASSSYCSGTRVVSFTERKSCATCGDSTLDPRRTP
jgi:DNA-binding response OmpR family regulator